MRAPILADPIDKDRDDACKHAVAREAVPKTDPLSSQEAFELVDEIASLAGVDSKNAWFGACHTVSAWLREPGCTLDVILTGVRNTLAKHRDRQIFSIRFFEPEIAREIARQSRPLPKVELVQPDGAPDAPAVHVGYECE